MDLLELDQFLAGWQSDCTNMSTNLLLLSETLPYQVLVEGDNRNQLSGKSLEQVSIASASVRRLYKNLGFLQSTLRTAQEERLRMPAIFGQRQAIDKILQIFENEVIEVSRESISLTEVHLLSSPTSSTFRSAQTLKGEMQSDFEITKSILMRIDGIWNDGEKKISEINAESQKLVATATALTNRRLSTVERLNARLQELQILLYKDPYEFESLRDSYATLQTFVDSAIREVQNLQLSRQQLSESTKNLPIKLSELQALRQRGFELFAKCRKCLDVEKVRQPGKTANLQQNMPQAREPLTGSEYDDLERKIDAWDSIYSARHSEFLAFVETCSLMLERATSLRSEFAKLEQKHLGSETLSQSKALAKFREAVLQCSKSPVQLDELAKRVSSYKVAVLERSGAIH